MLDVLLGDPQTTSSNQVISGTAHVSPLYRTSPVAIQLIKVSVLMRPDETHIVKGDLLLCVIRRCRASLACYQFVCPFKLLQGLKDARALVRRQGRAGLEEAVKKSSRFYPLSASE